MAFAKDKKYTAEDYFNLIFENDSERFELIDGNIVALASPSIIHQRIVGQVYSKINNYILSNKGKCEVFIAPTDVQLYENTIVIPDLFIVCDKDKIDEKKCNGAPDFVAEVVSSNRSNDYTKKLMLYQESGVREYWIIDPIYERTMVYFFEESYSPNIYTFDVDIPVNIYNGNLSICIKDLIG